MITTIKEFKKINENLFEDRIGEDVLDLMYLKKMSEEDAIDMVAGKEALDNEDVTIYFYRLLDNYFDIDGYNIKPTTILKNKRIIQYFNDNNNN